MTPITIFGDIFYDYVSDLTASGAALPDLATSDLDATSRINGRVGGNAVQVALAAVEAGFEPVTVVGKVGGDGVRGIDQDARAALGELDAAGVRSAVTPNPDVATGRAIVVYLPNDRRLMISDPGANATFTVDDIDERAYDSISRGGILFISGYALVQPGRRAAADRLVAFAQRAGTVVAIDVVPHQIDRFVASEEVLRRLRGTDWILIAEDTARRLLKLPRVEPADEVVSAVAKLADHVAVFRDPAQAAVVERGRRSWFRYAYQPGDGSRGQSACSQAALLARYVNGWTGRESRG